GGTVRVADIDPGLPGSFPAFLTADRDRLLFQACDAEAGCEPWQVTAGDAASRLSDLAPGAASSAPNGFVVSDGRVLFAADDAGSGTELWADGPCAGDCNGDGMVSIDELIRAIRIPLGESALEVCPAIDATGDGEVGINELIAAVNNALSGC